MLITQFRDFQKKSKRTPQKLFRIFFVDVLEMFWDFREAMVPWVSFNFSNGAKMGDQIASPLTPQWAKYPTSWQPGQPAS